MQCVAVRSRHSLEEPTNILLLQSHKQSPHLPGRLPLSKLGLRSRHIMQPASRCRLNCTVTPAAVRGLPKTAQGSHLLCHTHICRPPQVLGCLLLARRQLLLLHQQCSELLQFLILGCRGSDDCDGPIQPLRCPLCSLMRRPQAAYLRHARPLRQLGSCRLPLCWCCTSLWQAMSGGNTAYCKPVRATVGLLPPHLSCTNQGRPRRLHRPHVDGGRRTSRTGLPSTSQPA